MLELEAQKKVEAEKHRLEMIQKELSEVSKRREEEKKNKPSVKAQKFEDIVIQE
jgi:hypothetical protein